MPPLEIAEHADAPDDWDAFVHARGSFYHERAWTAAIAEQFDFEPLYLTARHSGSLVGVLPSVLMRGPLGRRRHVSLPFSYAAGPLAASGEASLGLIEQLRARASADHVRRVEIKQRGVDPPRLPDFSRSDHYATYVVPTTGGLDAVWKRLHPSHVQRGVKRARKTVSVDHGTGEEWAVMAELQQRSARRLGLPAPPMSFFTRTCAHLQTLGLADLLLARIPSGDRVAAIVLWKGRSEWIYAFGASLPEHWEHRPNHLLLWTALEGAVAAGVRFDLGRAAPEQKGLVAFKEHWGGERLSLAYDYWPAAGGLHALPRDRGLLAVGSRIWSHLPLALTRRASFLYRYLG
jgi:Acetyltransferase (GNAT) domain